MRTFALDEHARNHADHAPAGLQHRIRDDTHEPEAPAAVHQRDAALRQRAPHLLGRARVARPRPGRGAAEHADRTRHECPLRSGHAARRYEMADTRVSTAATMVSARPISNTGSSNTPGMMGRFQRNNMQERPTICRMVLSLPMPLTFTLPRLPISAIHSRNAEMAISRPMMTMAESTRMARTDSGRSV